MGEDDGGRGLGDPVSPDGKEPTASGHSVESRVAIGPLEWVDFADTDALQLELHALADHLADVRKAMPALGSTPDESKAFVIFLKGSSISRAERLVQSLMPGSSVLG